MQYLTDHCQVIQPSGKSNLGSKQYIWGVFLASASLCGCHQPFSSHLRKAAEVAAGLLHAPPPEAASAKEVPGAVTAHGQSWSDSVRLRVGLGALIEVFNIFGLFILASVSNL